MDIRIEENGIHLHIHITDEGDVRLYNLGSRRRDSPSDENSSAKYRLVEVHESGMNQNDHHGNKHTGSSPGSLLRYSGHDRRRNEFGTKFELTQEHKGLLVTSHMQFYDGISVVRTWTGLTNRGDSERPIEYVTSLALTGLSGGAGEMRDENCFISIPHSTWYGEAQWKRYTPGELGYDVVNDFSVKRIACSSTGTWPAGEYLPMGAFEDGVRRTALLWQIETHASWHWEISDIARELYLHASGPTYQESGFLRVLKPGESFESEACALALADGDFQTAVRAMMRYRRAVRRPNRDNAKPKVIFNDYMNCLSGDPTTEKLLPLIDAASDAGCRYFCIDAGWYDDGPWWNGVGEWLPAKNRFPGGIGEPLNRIREKGMIPGLWLELEVMGINCPLVKQAPEEWFFIRNGRPVIDEGRYQLDYRNPEVRRHADGVIRRVVEDYGVGYIKMDYNINAGPGTEYLADSPGDGLLRHTRAYLDWIDSVFERYPDLIIENCSSGGMRMTWSLLSRHSIQSVSDQTDYLKNAAIAANCMTAVTPEQAAIWSYPLADGDEDETVFNMVNALLLRVHMSGHLANLSKERLAFVHEGIEYHHRISAELARGLPFWPIGLASFGDEFMSTGVDCGSVKYLAVWRTRGSVGSVDLPIEVPQGRAADVAVGYPKRTPIDFRWNPAGSILHVRPPEKTAGIFEIRIR